MGKLVQQTGLAAASESTLPLMNGTTRRSVAPRWTRAAPLLALALACVGRPIVSASQYGERPATADELGATEVVKAFWLAAALADTVAMRSLATSDLPVKWALSWSRGRPGYFESTQRGLIVEVLRRRLGTPDTLEVIVRLSEPVCGLRGDRFARRQMEGDVVATLPRPRIVWVMSGIC